MIPTDGPPGRVALAHWLAAVAALIVAACLALFREWLAAVGFVVVAGAWAVTGVTPKK